MKKLTTLLFVASLTTITTASASDYEFVPANTADESKLCAIAAEKGLRAAVAEGGYYATTLYCNGAPIKNFSRRYTK